MTPALVAAISLPFLGDVVVFLVASVVLAYLCYRFRLEPIVGFLLAGVLIGPTSLGLVQDRALIDAMAEIGVMLLLFTIGVEFSLDKLNHIRRIVIGGGSFQVGLSVLVVTLLLVAVGRGFPQALYTGCLVALSSTAIVLKLIADRAETDSPVGKFALGILIFQDLAIIAMVLLLNTLGTGEQAFFGVLLALGEAIALIAIVIVSARRIVPWVLERVAMTQRVEIFLPAVVTICLGTAWLTNLAGVSLALGAFLAGLVVSESRYSSHALSEILPLRTLFNAAFFVSIGMLLDVQFLIANLPLILLTAALVLLIKLITAGIGVLAMGFPVRVAAAVGLTLAQIGEFSFVLERAGSEVGLSPAGLGETGTQFFIAVTVFLMGITPFMVRLAPGLGRAVERLGPKWDVGTSIEPPGPERLEDHVIIAGYGPAGRRLARVLQDVHLPFSIIDMNPRLAEDAQGMDCLAIHGDAVRAPILHMAGIENAKLLVVAVSDPVASERIVELAKYLNPTVQIIVRTRFTTEIEALNDAGADIVVPEDLETSIRIFTNVLNAYMIPAEEIRLQVNAIRSGDYEVFRGSIHEAHLMVLQGLDEEGLHTRAVAIREGAPVANKTLQEIGLRRRYQLTILAVRRDGKTIANPDGSFTLHSGDRIIMVGRADQFAEAADLFRSASTTAADASTIVGKETE